MRNGWQCLCGLIWHCAKQDLRPASGNTDLKESLAPVNSLLPAEAGWKPASTVRADRTTQKSSAISGVAEDGAF